MSEDTESKRLASGKKRGFETSKQRLADQARVFKVSGWLSEMEIEELKRGAMIDTEGEDEEEALGQM